MTVIILVMGSAASGKTTIGQALAAAHGWTFVEGDDLHPRANVEKMHRGEPLTDADRAPWLDRVRAKIDELRAAGRDAVVACSALREDYRARLGADRVVLLEVPRAVLEARLKTRVGHFFPPSLLDSQLATLERPHDAVTVDATKPVDEIVRAISAKLHSQ